MAPWDFRPSEVAAEREFPQLLAAIAACEKVLKKLRGLKNHGFAADEDLENARQARDQLLRILDAGRWQGRLES